MTNNPFFSVVIPTYNRAGLIGKAITSVLNQTFEDFELIVIDDGSTDNTMDVVSAITDKRLRYFRIENSERGAARNTGFQRSQGEYVNFVDSDDQLYPHHLLTAANFIQTHKSPAVFALGYDVKDENGKRLAVAPAVRNINTQILSGNVVACNGVFVRHSLMRQNLFNENRALAALEDWELWVRISARVPFLYLADITSSVIQHHGRSVMTGDVSLIKGKITAFIEAVTSDSMNQKTYGKKIKRLVASANTYGALHIVLTKAHGRDVLTYLWKGILANPFEIFTRRFVVITKLLIVK